MDLAARQLAPSQQKVIDWMNRALTVGNAFVVWGGTGMGKTTLLQELQRRHGGAIITMAQFMEAMTNQNPQAIEETFQHQVLEVMQKHDVVLIDDLSQLMHVICSNGCNAYTRPSLLELPLKAIVEFAAASGKKLIISHDNQTASAVRDRCFYTGIDQFTVDDYEFFCQEFLGGTGSMTLDFKKIHRFAPRLNAHQLRSACTWLAGEEHLNTDRFIDYLRSQRMASNVDLAEVQAVDLHDLKGIDDVIEALEANIILPLEDDRLATELGIKPKRGVLLAGPPGTGKTTVGRALAHRLKSKFFLVDGTFIAGSAQFYAQVHHIFEAAKNNAPSIIFIDDSDVIFQDGEEMGLYRYLLTMLDGLESASAGRVCVMMTAMDISALPPALVRSGRVELWLETRLPDNAGRANILQSLVPGIPASMGTVELPALAAATDGMTGADLKRVIEDAKILFGFDRSRGRTIRSATEYFLSAIQTVRDSKERYSVAEAQARLRRPSRPPWYDMMGAVSAHAITHFATNDPLRENP